MWLGCSVCILALLPFPYILLSREVIDAFTREADYYVTIRIIVLMVVLDWLLRMVNQFIDTELDKKVKRLEYGAIQKLFYKMSVLDYKLLDDADIKDKFEKATKCVMALNFYELILSVRTFFSSILVLVGVIGIIASVDGILLIAISLVIIMNAYANSRLKKYRYKVDNDLWPIDRKMEWFMQFCANIEYAKEIRVNQLQEFIFRRYRKLSDHYYSLLDNITESEGLVKWIGIILSSLQEGMAYLVLGYKIIVERTLTVGDFTMVFGAITSFKNACSGIINGIIEVLNRGRYFSNYLEFMELKDNSYKGELIEVDFDHGVEIEFKHVFFRYPNQNKYALKNVNVKILPFEKIAIIGDNGAGKTSFIKLLCRLYEPDEGVITINGRDIRDFDYCSYQKLLSVVFQDYRLFSFSIRDNILFSEYGEKKDEEIYKKAKCVGADDMLEKLPQGLNTLLFKDYDAEGVNLSGGESQKIAILRALFKESVVMILDEPTAALDPDTEKKIYESFRTFTKDKTAIYISHRLASTRYCDKILVFKDGELREEGSHESLIRRDGEYKRLYQIQADYYTD